MPGIKPGLPSPDTTAITTNIATTTKEIIKEQRKTGRREKKDTPGRVSRAGSPTPTQTQTMLSRCNTWSILVRTPGVLALISNHSQGLSMAPANGGAQAPGFCTRPVL